MSELCFVFSESELGILEVVSGFRFRLGDEVVGWLRSGLDSKLRFGLAEVEAEFGIDLDLDFVESLFLPDSRRRSPVTFGLGIGNCLWPGPEFMGWPKLAVFVAGAGLGLYLLESLVRPDGRRRAPVTLELGIEYWPGPGLMGWPKLVEFEAGAGLDFVDCSWLELEFELWGGAGDLLPELRS